VLRTAPLALRRRVVKQWLDRLPGMQGRVNFTKVEAVLNLLYAPNHSMTQTLAQIPTPIQPSQEPHLQPQQRAAVQGGHTPLPLRSASKEAMHESGRESQIGLKLLQERGPAISADQCAAFGATDAERRRMRKQAAKERGTIAVAAFVRGDLIDIDHLR